ncbi:MAG: hypothetical protein J6039_03420 [Alphaproteobacteria bacterium]|nr:hypothetical protein [Alphaproteobacteria bacterium]
MKKFLHYICFIVFGLIWIVALALLFRSVFILTNRVDILSPKTYRLLSAFWNHGGVLRAKDLMMFLGIIIYFPLCWYGLRKLYRFKYLNILSVPLNWIANYGADHYKTPSVNIKNLKVEEKKTLEQIVQERLDKEKKKQANAQPQDLRKKIIEQIEENKNL